MRSHPLVHLSRVKFLEFVREPEAIFWVLVFPVLLSLALGIAFRVEDRPSRWRSRVCDGPGAAEAARALERGSGPAPEGAREHDARESLRGGQGRARRDPGRHAHATGSIPTRDESRVAPARGRRRACSAPPGAWTRARRGCAR